MTYLLMFVSSC